LLAVAGSLKLSPTHRAAPVIGKTPKDRGVEASALALLMLAVSVHTAWGYEPSGMLYGLARAGMLLLGPLVNIFAGLLYSPPFLLLLYGWYKSKTLLSTLCLFLAGVYWIWVGWYLLVGWSV
jgi:hypothetical protein